MSKPKELIFIFGPQRTGSTLLHNLLKLHPDIHGTPNDLNLLDVSRKLFRIVKDGKQLRKFSSWGLDGFQGLYKMLLESSDDLNLYQKLIELYFKDREESVLVHKNPKAELELDLYRKMFPSSKYIFCVRNPISIMASRKHWVENEDSWVLDTGIYSLISLLKHIQKSLNFIFKSYSIIDEEYGKSDILGIVFYEDLVQNPKLALNHIINTVGLEINQILSQVDNLKNPYSSYENNKKKSGLYTNSIMNWKSALNPFEIKLILEDMINFKNDYEFKSDVMERQFNKYVNLVKNTKIKDTTDDRKK